MLYYTERFFFTIVTKPNLIIRCRWIRKSVKPRQTERGNAHGGATKKREITSLSINLHF